MRKSTLLFIFTFFCGGTSLNFACGGGGGTKYEPAPTPKTAAKPAATSGGAPATLTGTVNFEGAVPTLSTLKMDAEPICAAKHTTPPKSQALALGAGNTLGNVFVKIKSGVATKSYPAPSEPVVLDQNGCIYEPHLFGVMVGQTLKILNSDGILHNIHPLPKVNKEFNLAMPKFKKVSERAFDKAEEEPFLIKCDVHPWMGAYAAVMPHPFFDVTATDGKFSIAGLDPGTYEVEAWHEKMGTQTSSITVAAGESKTVDFTFKR
jgi:plastocyanin